MTDAEYIMYEFSKARGKGDKIHVKVRGEDGESRWVGIPAANLDDLIAAAQKGAES